MSEGTICSEKRSEFKRRELLPFRMPDFVRTTWVSLAAEQEWRFRFSRIAYAWQQAEVESVRSRVRECALIFVRAADMPDLMSNLGELKPRLLERRAQNVSRFAIGVGSSLDRFAEAWSSRDDRTMGGLLGYPPCCIEFFCELWTTHGQIDTIWEMAEASTNGTAHAERLIEIPIRPLTNILLRILGPRLCPHLPCSFMCAQSEALANRMRMQLLDLGFHDEVEWLNQALSWPVEWSGLHGIAEVRTPVVRAITRTDPTAQEFRVRLLGSSYPEKGARSKLFPYSPKPSQAHQDRLVHLRKRASTSAVAKLSCESNGFRTEAAMAQAHAALETAVLAACSGMDAPRVLDLGCGDGAFLARLVNSLPRLKAFGVDLVRDKVATANERFGSGFIVADILSSNEWATKFHHIDLVLVMIGRLLDPVAGPDLLKVIRSVAPRALLYAYDGWSSDGLQLEQAASQLRIPISRVYGGVAALCTNSEEGADYARPEH